MPSVVHEHARHTARPAVEASITAPAHTAEPDAHGGAAHGGRRGINWRHVMVAAVVGMLAGAAIPGGIQVAERAGVSGDQSSLRAVAMDYLAAIADGRASDASAMVAVQPAALVPDAVLQSARRITEPEVRLVHIDGDAASVEVEYTLGRAQISRTLEADRVDGSWQLSRPLTEAVTFYQYSPIAGARIAGIEISLNQPLYMYPGIYTVDPMLDDAILASRSEPFSVDGNPGTPSEPFVETTLLPDVAQRAEAIALAVGERCGQAGTCGVAPDATLRIEQDVWVMEATQQSVALIAIVEATTSNSLEMYQVHMQIERDAADGAGAWLCSPLDAYDLIDLEPCPAVD